MSDEPTAVSGEQPQTPPETPETPPEAVVVPEPTPTVTLEMLDQMRKDRDVDGLRKVIAGANMPKGAAPAGEPPAVPPPQEPPVAGKPPAGSEEAKDPKFFDIRFRGEDVKLPDNDNYLGHGSFGKLKRASAHQAKTLESYETRINTAETETTRYRRENEELRAAQVSAPPPPIEPPPEETPPAASAPPAPLGDVVIPTAPAEPEYSSADPMDWTDADRAKQASHRKERVAYDKAMNATLAKLVEVAKAPQQPGPYNNDPALVQKIEDQGEFIEGLKSEQATEVAETQKINFWNGMTEFQGLHKEELATPIPLHELHEKVGSWMHGLAWANGVAPPENATDAQLAQYDAAKTELVQKFLKEDAAVVEAAVGTPAPDGYKQYFRIAEYQKRLKALVATGKLGDKATLQDAWEKDYVSKELDGDVSALEAEARSDGSRSVLDSLGSAQRENAAHIPNNAAVQPPGGEQGLPPDEIGKDEAMQILKMPIQEVRRQGLEKKRELIVSRLRAK